MIKYALTAVALLGVGFAAGRLTVPPRDPQAAALWRRAAPEEPGPGPVKRGCNRKEPQPGAWDPAGEVVPEDGHLETVQELFAALERMAANPATARRDLMDSVQAKLLHELRENPSALAWALGRFRATAGTEPGGLLAITLGLLKDPAVEALALELAGNGNRQQRLAALELLDRLDIENRTTREAILRMLRTETDPELLAAALYTIPAGVPEPNEARAVTEALQPLTAHEDPEVRRRAVLAVAEWARDAAGLEPVLKALADFSVDVRAGAAFALAQAPAATPEVLGALSARVADEKEDWAVREQAWRAMARFPMDQHAYAVYAAFKARHDAIGEQQEEAQAGGSCRDH